MDFMTRELSFLNLPASQIDRTWLDANSISEPVGFIRWLVKNDFVEPAYTHENKRYGTFYDVFSGLDIKSALDDMADDLNSFGESFLDVVKAVYKAGDSSEPYSKALAVFNIEDTVN